MFDGKVIGDAVRAGLMLIIVVTFIIAFVLGSFCNFAVSKIKTYDIKIEKRVEKDKPIKE